MLRLRGWVFFGLLFLIGLWIVGTSQSFHDCLAAKTPPGATTEPQNHGTTFVVAMSPRGCLAQYVRAHREDIVASFALILALATIFLWFATRELVEGAEASSKMQLRAYLGPSESFITGVAVGERPVVETTIRNFGQTPALKVRHWAVAKVLDPTSGRFERGAPGNGERTINPGRDGLMIRSSVAEAISEEAMARIKLGTAAVCLYGVVTYRDVFGRSRKTEFRLQHGGPRLVGSEDLVTSAKGNRSN
jgi:hypothetical protein